MSSMICRSHQFSLALLCSTFVAFATGAVVAADRTVPVVEGDAADISRRERVAPLVISEGRPSGHKDVVASFSDAGRPTWRFETRMTYGAGMKVPLSDGLYEAGPVQDAENQERTVAFRRLREFSDDRQRPQKETLIHLPPRATLTARVDGVVHWTYQISVHHIYDEPVPRAHLMVTHRSERTSDRVDRTDLHTLEDGTVNVGDVLEVPVCGDRLEVREILVRSRGDRHPGWVTLRLADSNAALPEARRP